MIWLATGGGGDGERLSNCSKAIYYKSLLGAIFVHTCGLTSIYNSMYTVFSMICLSEQVRLIELET